MRRGLPIVIVLVFTLTPLVGVAKPFWHVDDWNMRAGICDWFAGSAATAARAWATGYDGHSATKRTGPTFGGDWTDKSLPVSSECRLNDVFVLPTDTSYVWIVGEDKSSHSGFVVYTQDDGDNWTKVEPLANGTEWLSPFYAVCFADEGLGYIGAGNGIILKTVDGGANWTRLDGTGTWSVADCFVDIWTNPGAGDTVWAVSDNNSEIVQSTNGGSNWSLYAGSNLDTTYNIPGVGYQPGRFVTFDVSFPLADSGAIALSHGKVAKSTDFGSNWSVSNLELAPSWFEACDYGSNDTLYLAGQWGTIRSEPGEIEYVNDQFGFHDIDMVGDSGRGFVVGDHPGDITKGRKYRRYDPVGFEFDEIYCECKEFCEGARIHLKWSTSFEHNTKEWQRSIDWLPVVQNGPDASPTLAAQGTTNTSHEYDWYFDVEDVDKITYYYSLYLNTWDEGVTRLHLGTWNVTVECPECPWETLCVPDPPEDVIAQDKSGDQGRTVELSWTDPGDDCGKGFVVGKSYNQDGPFFMMDDCGQETYSDDDHALPGREHYYMVCSFGELQSSSQRASTPVTVSAVPTDDLAPDTVLSFKHDFQERDGDSIRIRFTWEEDTEDSTVCGYWFCPIDNQIMTRTVVHKAPIQRNWYMLKGTWKSDESIIAGVLPMDCSGNMASGSWKDDTLNVANYQTAHWNATGHNNANRIAQTSDGNMHIAFSSNENDTDFVYYQKSTDLGEDWSTPVKIGRGTDPCVQASTDSSSYPYIVWRMTEPSGLNLIGKLYFSKYSGGSWTTPCEFYSTTGREFAVGSPAAVTDTANVANIVWKARENIVGNSYKDIVFVGYLGLGVGCGQFSMDTIDVVWQGVVAPDSMQASPSIDLDLENYPHIVWEKSDDIYYAAKDSTGWPATYSNISGTASKESRNPHIDIQGDWIRAVWEEQHTPSSEEYDILVWSYWKGSVLDDAQKSSICNNSLEPVIDRNFIAWSEKVGGKYEIFVSPYDYETYGWGDSINMSKYPYGDSRYPQVFVPVVTCDKVSTPPTYFYWVEGSAGYWTVFREKTFTKKQPYYPHDVGLEDQSPVTIERDGYLTYGTSTYETVDYDTDTLIYQCNLDPDHAYTLELTYYHEGGSGRTYELLIDGVPVDTSSAPSQGKVTVEETLSDSAVADGQITVEVTASNGDTVTCGDFLLFQCDDEGGFGGGQSVKRRRPGLLTSPVLKAPRPNPSLGRPVIEYFLPDERHAKVHVFDVSGRLVESIASGVQKPGWHRVVWNTDDNGAGVYLCRMDAGDVQMTHKLILVR